MTAAVGAGLFGAIFAFVVAVAIAICSVGAQALSYRAYGYWVGQFQPAKWGGIEEPMPFEPGYRPHAAAAPSSNVGADEGYESFQDAAAAAGAAAAGVALAECVQEAAVLAVSPLSRI